MRHPPNKRLGMASSSGISEPQAVESPNSLSGRPPVASSSLDMLVRYQSFVNTRWVPRSVDTWKKGRRGCHVTTPCSCPGVATSWGLIWHRWRERLMIFKAASSPAEYSSCLSHNSSHLHHLFSSPSRFFSINSCAVFFLIQTF